MRGWWLAIVLASSVAGAQELSGAQLAIQLGQQGDKFWSTGRCDAAIDAWTKADKAYHAPTLLFRIARCQALLGLVVESTANFKAVVDQPLAPDAPPSWKEAHDQAESWLPGVEERVAHFSIAASGLPDGAHLDARLDGEPIDLGVPVARNPGHHEVSLALGNGKLTRPIELENGSKSELKVTVQTTPAREPNRWPRRIGWGFAAGGAATAVGSVLIFGLQALSLRDQLRADPRCSADKVCSPEVKPQIDRMTTYSTLSDAGLGIGSAFAIAGAVLLFFIPVPTPGEPGVTLSAGFNTLTAAGSF